MATASSNEFQLVVPETAQRTIVKIGDEFIIPCHLSPEISAVDMEIIWFKETDCVCIYKNREMIEGRRYEDEVNPFTEVLERGDVSLSLKNFRESDLGDYVCQVTSGVKTEEITVRVKDERLRFPQPRWETLISTFADLRIKVEIVNRTWTEEEKSKMDESALMAESKQMLQMKDMALKQKDRRLKDMNDKLLQTIKELKKTQSQLEEKETQMDNMNKLMIEKERLLENTVKQLETNQLHLYTLRNELREMKTQLDEQKTKFPHQEKTLHEHKQQQKQSDQENKNLHSELERLKNESSTHLSQLNEKCKCLEDMVKLLDKRETEIKKLEKSKVTALEEKDKLLNKSNNKLLQTTREIEEKNKLMNEKQRQLENTVKELETSKHQLESLRNELQVMKTQLDEQKTKFTHQEKTLQEHKQQQQRSDEEIRNLHCELERLKSESSTHLSEASVSTAPVRRRNSKGLDPPKMSAPVKRTSFELDLPNMSGETASVLVSGSELRLVLVGSAGSEKSASVNIILNREEKIQTDTSTEIQQSESRQGEVNGKQVTVVETPDWFCSGLSLEEVREDVRLCVRLSAPGPHAFLLIIPVQQSTGVERAMLEKMEIFGERCWSHTMIIFTVTGEEQKKNIEDFVQSGNQEVQRLVEKCGNRFHCLNIHQSGDDSQISELLEKIEKMVEGNTERFYSSEIYLEIESQIRAIERKIIRDTEERKEREERDMKEKFEKEVQRSLRKIEVAIKEHEGDIQQLNERTGELERQMREERDEKKKKELKRELEKEVEKRSELERKINKLKDQREREKIEMEEKHRQEMDEIRQMYEGEIRVETERNLMKIILPGIQKYIFYSKSNMQEEFNRQMEQKNRDFETLKNHLSELKEKYSSLCEFHESAIEILKTS